MVFAVGGLLVAAGAGALAARVRGSRAALAGVGLTWLAMVLMAPSAFLEVFVSPHVDHEVMHEVEAAAAGVGALTALSLFVGPLLLTVAGARRRVLPRWLPVAVVVAVLLLAVGPAVLVPEGLAIVPGTALLGLALAVAGWSAQGPREG